MSSDLMVFNQPIEKWDLSNVKTLDNLLSGCTSFNQPVEKLKGIPVRQLTEAESERLLRMEEEISSRLIGQDEAVGVVSRAIRRARTGLRDPRRPIGSFLFMLLG